MSGVRPRRRLHGPRNPLTDRSGVSAMEFALVLPIFVAFTLVGTEMTHIITTTLKVQRLATMSADMVAQRGASDKRLSELQMYDILDAMSVAAQPLDMQDRGRIAISAVVGEDTNSDNRADVNRIKWQRFAGSMTDVPLLMGCHSTSTRATLRDDRQLGLDESMFHAQVTYRYEPLVGQTGFGWLQLPQTITRTATFRGRGGAFKPILQVEGYPARESCTT